MMSTKSKVAHSDRISERRKALFPSDVSDSNFSDVQALDSLEDDVVNSPFSFFKNRFDDYVVVEDYGRKERGSEMSLHSESTRMSPLYLSPMHTLVSSPLLYSPNVRLSKSPNESPNVTLAKSPSFKTPNDGTVKVNSKQQKRKVDGEVPSSASKVRTALFPDDDVAMPPKCFYGAVKLEKNVANNSPVYMNSRNEKRGNSNALRVKKKRLGRINAGVMHKIRKPKRKNAQFIKVALSRWEKKPLDGYLNEIANITSSKRQIKPLPEIQPMDSIEKTFGDSFEQVKNKNVGKIQGVYALNTFENSFDQTKVGNDKIRQIDALNLKNSEQNLQKIEQNLQNKEQILQKTTILSLTSIVDIFQKTSTKKITSDQEDNVDENSQTKNKFFKSRNSHPTPKINENVTLDFINGEVKVAMGKKRKAPLVDATNIAPKRSLVHTITNVAPKKPSFEINASFDDDKEENVDIERLLATIDHDWIGDEKNLAKENQREEMAEYVDENQKECINVVEENRLVNFGENNRKVYKNLESQYQNVQNNVSEVYRKAQNNIDEWATGPSSRDHKLCNKMNIDEEYRKVQKKYEEEHQPVEMFEDFVNMDDFQEALVNYNENGDQSPIRQSAFNCHNNDQNLLKCHDDTPNCQMDLSKLDHQNDASKPNCEQSTFKRNNNDTNLFSSHNDAMNYEEHILSCQNNTLDDQSALNCFNDVTNFQQSALNYRNNSIKDQSDNETINYQQSALNCLNDIINCQQNALNYHNNAFKDQSALNCHNDAINCQQSSLNCNNNAVNDQSLLNCHNEVINCQQSALNCQNDTMNCQQSALNCHNNAFKDQSAMIIQNHNERNCQNECPSQNYQNKQSSAVNKHLTSVYHDEQLSSSCQDVEITLSCTQNAETSLHCQNVETSLCCQNVKTFLDCQNVEKNVQTRVGQKDNFTRELRKSNYCRREALQKNDVKQESMHKSAYKQKAIVKNQRIRKQMFVENLVLKNGIGRDSKTRSNAPNTVQKNFAMRQNRRTSLILQNCQKAVEEENEGSDERRRSLPTKLASEIMNTRSLRGRQVRKVGSVENKTQNSFTVLQEVQIDHSPPPNVTSYTLQPTAREKDNLILSPTSQMCDMASVLAINSPKRARLNINTILDKTPSLGSIFASKSSPNSSLGNTPDKLPVFSMSSSSPDIMNAETTKEVPEECAKKLFPIFTRSHNPLAPTQSIKTAKTAKATKWKSLPEDQMLLDAGQKRFGVTQCPECQLMYTMGDPNEEIKHLNYHNATNVLRFNGWRNERVVTSIDTSTRVIKIVPGDSKAWWKRVKDLVEFIDRELGFCKTDSTTLQHSQVYLHIKNRQITGCLVAEPRTSAHRMLPSDTVDVCSEESYPVKCGVSRIWTSGNHRMQGIASTLMDVLKANIIPGYVLKMEDIALSAPTDGGKAFAKKYFKTGAFYVYLG